MGNDPAAFLAGAVEAARAAGAVIQEGARNRASLTIERKTANDFVSEVDKRAERAIIVTLSARFPSHAYKAEESGESGTSRHTWIIDPLDGTTNYAHGYPCFCVTLALEHNGDIVIGVTYDPTRNELFATERGRGATLNGRPIRVSATEKLSEALIVTGFPYDFKDKDNFARHLTDFLFHSRGVRRDGSAALDMAYVACGRFDGFWEEGLSPWDVAAGKLLIEEAGGQITYYDGAPFSIYAPPICASNGSIHSEMLKVLN
jgi:myo-inositol-1(or 4)-monophosphatase